MESKGHRSKLGQKWIGPFEIMQCLNPGVYRLRMSNRYPGLPIFNLQHFKKYEESPTELGDRTKLPKTRLKKPEKEEFVVEKIIAHKFDKKSQKVKYLVRWLDYGLQFNTWEPRANLKNAPLIFSKYQRKHNL
jgi:hypothetical protein